MGQLARFIQQSFSTLCPKGWTCSAEKRVVSLELEKLLGYSPRADVCLERDDGSRRLWIEFEISRADPVANHAKFATSHLFRSFEPSDVFVSMVSSHVTRGRRNLASNTIHLLRHVGINSFQTVLLPAIEPERIKQLNHSSLQQLKHAGLDIPAEQKRVFQVVDPVLESDGHRIHFASELFEVMRNLHLWNQQISAPLAGEQWKRRTVTYFVFDPVSKLFAPSKFCAYVIPNGPTEIDDVSSVGMMNVATYSKLDQKDRRFDGQRARVHLTTNLGMVITQPSESPAIERAFGNWCSKNEVSIKVHPSGPKIIRPPDWY
ncbi:hypothetical protein Enr13x_03890 [Stieleria neptunia]|uniref:Uncharacterized protein n=1 Tax=Stieleria neptunia TaxID=2527979 RepID=A0A518HIF1_9BACT|nr:hypothetical protein [Stieleria neptunia]QDV40583.1 hypothetical protein Enr13x_03890 [Stieleria neptunia]